MSSQEIKYLTWSLGSETPMGMGIQGKLPERLFPGDATDGQCMFVKLADRNYIYVCTIGFPAFFC